jgi:hypothetical protein
MVNQGYNHRALGIALAAAILAACGSGNVAGSLPQTTVVEPAGSYVTPPKVEGTYHGSYAETRNGKTVKGSLRIVIREKRFKITGSFDIQGKGYQYPVKTYFVGKAKEAPKGALLRFQVVWLGGYGNSVNVRANVRGMTLDGKGHSQETEGEEASSWSIKATRSDQ